LRHHHALRIGDDVGCWSFTHGTSLTDSTRLWESAKRSNV
jgi:hypothetical protein